MARSYTLNTDDNTIPDYTVVDVILNDGTLIKNRPAGNYPWRQFGEPSDIKFWRISKDKK